MSSMSHYFGFLAFFSPYKDRSFELSVRGVLSVLKKQSVSS